MIGMLKKVAHVIQYANFQRILCKKYLKKPTNDDNYIKKRDWHLNIKQNVMC